MAPAQIAKQRLPVVDGRSTTDNLKKDIEGARSHDLVFAVVGYAGAGAGTVADFLVRALGGKGFHPRLVKASALITDAADEFQLESPHPLQSEEGLTRAVKLQDCGDELRRRHGTTIVAGLAVREIDHMRGEAPNDGALAFVVDSLKHPEEVDALRSIYGNGFYLISVVCEPEERKKRLAHKLNIDRESLDLRSYMTRDEDGGLDTGQRVRKTIHRGDFFINNQGQKDVILPGELARFVDIITGQTVQRPRREERGMYAAWSAAHRSSCLSRQVGAAILDGPGNLIASGTNDAPRFGGGLYENEEGATENKDFRCFTWAGDAPHPHCRNDREKRKIHIDIYDALKAAGLLKEEVSAEAVRKSVEKTRVRDLIEFSRAVHAEMEALLSLARNGGPSSMGGTLFTTTYPCHSCARHIVAAGIVEVVYLEAYPKSLASTLHSDSIVDAVSRETIKDQKVHFRVFTGVAPRRYAALFEQRRDLKDGDGNLIYTPRGAPPTHADPVFTKSFLDFEKVIARRITDLAGGARER